MQAEQIIYTSCRRGIAGDHSGFQNYSYSPQLAQWLEHANDIGTFQVYDPPQSSTLPALPTQEEAQTLYPRRRVFAKIDGPDQLYGMAQITYIGRDYPQGSVRGGNFISHAAILPQNQVDDYPCRYLHAPDFRQWLDVELARSEQVPDFLPQLELRAGMKTSEEEIRDFFAQHPIQEAFSTLLAALLCRNNGGSPRKILIIASETDFISLISALEYVLPVRQALDWGFSTYEKNIGYATVDVIRIDPKYPPTENLDYFWQFDFSQLQAPRVSTAGLQVPAVVQEACTFLVTGFCANSLELKSFHVFLAGTSFTATNETIGHLYRLFALENGTETIGTIPAADLPALCEAACFAAEENREQVQWDLIEHLASQVQPEAWTSAAEAGIELLLHTQPERRKEVVEGLCLYLQQLLSEDGKSLELFSQVRQFAVRLGARQQAGQRGELQSAELDTSRTEIETALFQQLVSGTEMQLALGNEHSLPWTVEVFAELTSTALTHDLNQLRQRGQQFALGQPVQQLVGQLSQDSRGALDKLVAAAINGNEAQGELIIQALSSRWQAFPELNILLGLLVMAAQPQVPATAQAGEDLLWRMFAVNDLPLQVKILQSINASGLAEVVLSFYRRTAAVSPSSGVFIEFVRQTWTALPTAFQNLHASQLFAILASLKLTDLTTGLLLLQTVSALGLTRQVDQAAIANLGYQVERLVPVLEPTTKLAQLQELQKQFKQLGIQEMGWLRLALQLVQAAMLAEEAKKRRPNEMVLRSSCQALTAQGSSLRLASLAEKQSQQEYLAKLAQFLGQSVSSHPLCMQLPFVCVPPQQAYQLAKMVFWEVARKRDAQDSLYQLAAMYAYLCGAWGPIARFDEAAVVSRCAQLLFDAKMKAAALEKIVTDDRKNEKFLETVPQVIGVRIDARSFGAFVTKVLTNLHTLEGAKGSLFGRLLGR